MDERQFKEIMSRVDRITDLLALNIIRDLASQKEKILMLSSFEFGPTDIARLLGTTANTVNVVLSKARRKGLSDKKGRTK